LTFPTAHNLPQASAAALRQALYAQTTNRSREWRVSTSTADEQPLRARDFLKVERTLGLIKPNQPIVSRRLSGAADNIDVRLTEAE
jgi:hypothetical protein